LTASAFIVFWKYWYKAPTCFDNFKNGDETGIDCGGSCSLVCSAEALAPVIRSDPRIFEVYPGVYSLLTFVENHNIDSTALNVPYKFKVYDVNGKLLAERSSLVTLTRNKTSAIFEGPVVASSSRPAKVTFELSKNIIWTKDKSPAPELTVTHSPLLDADKSPLIEAKVTNKSTKDLQNIEIVAVILDGRDNAIAASRSFVERLKSSASEDVFFTWPRPFNLSEKICEKSSDIILLLDRSGSMASLGKNPPEPLTMVKAAAVEFVSQLRGGDKVGVISFATEPSNPPDSPIAEDFTSVKSAINKIDIGKVGTQYTNISNALLAALDLLASREKNNASKVIILLTDGVATSEKTSNSVKAEAEALTEANKAKEAGINIFTIGLGKDIHVDFLKTIASSSANYYFAPKAEDLKKIYQDISSSICKETPARIELLSKVLHE